ncbi:MAG TPA: AAA family ATPase [Acetobacteraceae bacterium]|nr:AAA family ATPase [Acetobacteraceae bacterium]
MTAHDRVWIAIVGGINGAGKSTTTQELRGDPDFAGAEFLDPDRIAAAVAARNPSLTPAAANFAGLREVAVAIEQLIAARKPLVAETVLANVAYRRICEDAKKQGMLVRLLYVGLPTVEDSIARVALRVSKGGHDVPEADIRRRWPRTHENLAWFALHADAVDVFANIWNAPPKLIAQAREGRIALLDADTLPAVTSVLRPLL